MSIANDILRSPLRYPLSCCKNVHSFFFCRNNGRQHTSVGCRMRRRHGQGQSHGTRVGGQGGRSKG